MSWHVFIPFKANGESKQRLGLSRAESNQLATEWLGHVLDCCEQCPLVNRITLVTAGDVLPYPQPVFRQQARGLNEGLQEAIDHHGAKNYLVLLPDLPRLTSDDLTEFLDNCPQAGTALAPDRHRQGCNALAVRGVSPELCFGTNSLQKFRAQLPQAEVVYLPNVAEDIDTLEDWHNLCH